MKLKDLMITGAMVTTMGFTGTLLAGESEYFTQLDANGDGTLSMEEASADPVLRDSWTNADANQDGMIERAEFSAFEMKAGESAKYK